MLKKRLVQLVVAVALTVAVAGGSGIVAEQIGLDVMPQLYACQTSGAGGGC